MFHSSEVTAIAKSSFVGDSDYIHLIPMSELGLDIYLTTDVVKESGFTPNLVKAECELVVSVELDEQSRPRAARVHSIGGHLPPVTDVRSPEPIATQVRQPNIKQYLNPLKAAENSETSEVLWRIRDKYNQLVQYAVCDSWGNVLRQLGFIAENVGRENVGLVQEVQSVIAINEVTPLKPKRRIVKRTRTQRGREVKKSLLVSELMDGPVNGIPDTAMAAAFLASVRQPAQMNT